MNKTKWIIGLSMVGVMALSGTAFALNSGSAVAQSIGHTLGLRPNVNAIHNQGVMGSQGTSGNGSGYGVMGGQGTNGNGSGYGMMGSQGTSGNGSGYGVMGGQGTNGNGSGYGMMGGQGINGNGSGYDMMGGGYDANGLGITLVDGQVTTSDQAIAIAKAYAEKANQGVVVEEIHEYSNGYEVELKEAASGAKAYEVMLYKNGGQIINEVGPNVMWNTKYGHMNWGNNGAVTVSEEQATKSAQEFATNLGEGYSIDKPELAPGYYEFMIQKDGKDYAELDVNGYTGQVWFENWHGPVINTIESAQVG